MEQRAYRVRFEDVAVADLRDRLARTRWPERETVADWSQGVPLSYAKEVCAYWANEYDFGAAEERLNACPQFLTEVDGLDVHYLHVPSPHAGALPLVLTHGWPGSFVEFLGVIASLVDPPDPADAFHVVVPSLPGYGFSSKPTSAGWNVVRIARAWDTLMTGLGYGRYGAQGGDWGAIVTTSLARHHGAHLAGVHVNMAVVPYSKVDQADLTPEEEEALARTAEHTKMGRGYSEEQATRPQTLGYGLSDSPAGQCAWILEKFWAWTDCGGHPERALTKDQMLDNISVYWFGETSTSSARLYWESLRSADLGPVEVPSGVTVFPKEIFTPSRRWVETLYRDLRWYNRPDRGGHFAAFEQPGLFVEEVRSFFRLVR